MVAETLTANNVVAGEVIVRLPDVFIQPVAVPLEAIERGLVRGSAAGNDARYNKF